MLTKLSVPSWVKVKDAKMIGYVSGYSPSTTVYTICLDRGAVVPERYRHHSYTIEGFPRFPVRVTDVEEVLPTCGPPIEVFARFSTQSSMVTLHETYHTVVDYAEKVMNIKLATIPAGRIGRRLSAIARERNIEIRKVKHAIYQSVHSYPESLFEELKEEIAKIASTFRPL